MYSQAEAHLANLDLCGGPGLRRAYLVLMFGLERAGLQTAAREAGGEVAVRDATGRQPFAVTVSRDGIGFDLRRPALDADAGLAGRIVADFAGRTRGSADSTGEVRIRVTSEAEAEDIVEWLLQGEPFSPGYAGRKSA